VSAKSRPLFTATHCDTLQHTATHCNTLQHTATRRSEHEGEREVEAFMRSIPICSPRKKHITGNISYFSKVGVSRKSYKFQLAATHCNTLQQILDTLQTQAIFLQSRHFSKVVSISQKSYENLKSSINFSKVGEISRKSYTFLKSRIIFSKVVQISQKSEKCERPDRGI